MKKRKEFIYFGSIPEIGGYGINVLSYDELACMRLLKAEYYQWKKSYHLSATFKRALEYYGGGVRKIQINKIYFDGFGE